MQINDTDRLIEHLKIVNDTVVARCYTIPVPGDLNLVWTPTIERNTTHGAFLTEAPEHIYKSGKAPRMDVVFSFNSQEYILFRPNLTEITKPLLGTDLSNATLPFNSFHRSTHPKVNLSFFFSEIKRQFITIPLLFLRFICRNTKKC